MRPEQSRRTPARPSSAAASPFRPPSRMTPAESLRRPPGGCASPASVAIATPPIRIHTSGWLNTGADASRHARHTTRPVIKPYRQTAKASSATAGHGHPASAASIASPDVATLASSQPPRARSRRPVQPRCHTSRTVSGNNTSHASAATTPRMACKAGSRVATTAQAATNVNSCSSTSRSPMSGRGRGRDDHHHRQHNGREYSQPAADAVEAVIGRRDRHDAGRHHRRERVGSHASSSTTR